MRGFSIRRCAAKVCPVSPGRTTSVGEDLARTLAGDDQGFGSVTGGQDCAPGRAQNFTSHISDKSFVFDQQDRLRGADRCFLESTIPSGCVYRFPRLHIHCHVAQISGLLELRSHCQPFDRHGRASHFRAVISETTALRCGEFGNCDPATWGCGSVGESHRDRVPIRHPRVSGYFGLVRMVSLGSRTILCVPAGAGRRNVDSSPSANTRPSKTCLPAASA